MVADEEIQRLEDLLALLEAQIGGIRADLRRQDIDPDLAQTMNGEYILIGPISNHVSAYAALLLLKGASRASR